VREVEGGKEREKSGEPRKKAFLIYFGLGGHGVEFYESRREGRRMRGHISGYDSPESFERQLSRGEEENYPPLSGVPVLDKRVILEKHPEYSFRSPLVDVDVRDGEVDRVNTESARSMLPRLSGGFDVMAAAAIAHEGRKDPGPLDSVSVRDYIAWWVSRGARLGYMDEEGKRIQWEERDG
jgi:hypothetical protein